MWHSHGQDIVKSFWEVGMATAEKTTIQDRARHGWLMSNRHLLISNERQDASIFRAGYVIDDPQIATLYRGQRYEDETDIPRSDARMLRLRR